MKGLVLIGCGLLLCAATDMPDGTALQARLDRVLLAAGRPAGSLKAVWAVDEELRLEQGGRAMAIPRSLIALAPSGGVLDGMLAMMAAYQEPSVHKAREISAGEIAAVAALTAVTGGASDNGSATEKVLPIIPDGFARKGRFSSSGRQAAWRGARWSAAAGACRSELVGFLRQLATEPGATVRGKSVKLASGAAARRILRDMGSLSYPSPEGCSAVRDANFDALQSTI